MPARRERRELLRRSHPCGGPRAGTSPAPTILLIDRSIQPLEEAERGWRLGEAAAPVEALRVAGAEQPAAQPLEVRMRQDGVDEMAAEPFAALGLDDEDIGEIGEGRVVGDHPGEADLLGTPIEAEGERVLDRALHDGEG